MENNDQKKELENKDFVSFAHKFGIKVEVKDTEYNKDFFIKERNLDLHKLITYFESEGFRKTEAIPLVQPANATTIFVSSGIQVLDTCIHHETELPEVPIFIAQPVIRSQYYGSDKTETHTAFHNLSTVSVNISVEQHVYNLSLWIEYFCKNGYDRENFTFDIINSSPKWGSRRFSNFVIGIKYGGLDIGDAVYIPSMPQITRGAFSISDIGFGLERLEHRASNENQAPQDCLKTIALLAISGVEPGNKGASYRFRLFSKRLVNLCELDYARLKDFLSNTRDFLLDWSTTVSEPITDYNFLEKRIFTECERNFNSSLLTYLKSEYGYGSSVEINQSVLKFLKQLRLIGNKPGVFWDDLQMQLNM